MSQENTESSPSTPHRRKRLGEVIELDEKARRPDSALNHTRDEQLYSDEEIEEEDEDEEEEEDFDELDDEDG